jgi:hypothetical protein
MQRKKWFTFIISEIILSSERMYLFSSNLSLILSISSPNSLNPIFIEIYKEKSMKLRKNIEVTLMHS